MKDGSDKHGGIPIDPIIGAAGRALAKGDPLGALKRVSLRNDAPALALRGIAMAQLGDFSRAKALLQRAIRAFGETDAVARSKCTIAVAEIALVSRDLSWSTKAITSARVTLEEHGDRLNAAHARYLEVRHLLLIGRLNEAARTLAQVDSTHLPPASMAAYQLVLGGISIRRLHAKKARVALATAARAAAVAGIPGLQVEIEHAGAALNQPVARLISGGQERLLLLEEVEELLDSGAIIVDACRRSVRDGQMVISLATRPVLFALARTLGEAWPADVARGPLVEKAFQGKRADESHRARLRVEVGRLRSILQKLVGVSATMRGFVLEPLRSRQIVVIAPPIEDENGEVLALLADGESWSSSALALALGASQRSVQRALDSLAEVGKVQSFGGGRALRWTTPVLGFPSTLLLPAELSNA